MDETIISNSETDTINFAKIIAKKLTSPCVLCLYGDLGMGKTVFARALIRALCNNESLEVASPTFTLVQHYETPDTTIQHYDLYRIEDPEDIFALGWEESLDDGITIVEWPERLGTYKPAYTQDVKITNHGQGARNITIEGALT